MRWQQTEFILKGIYLGLLLYVALQAQSWNDVGTVAATTVGGLVICLAVAAVRKLREGYRVKGRFVAFLLFLLLENPGLVYAGVILGLAVGAFYISPETNEDRAVLLTTLVGGAFLGVVFWVLRHVEKRDVRFWLCLALGAILIGGTIGMLKYNEIQQNMWFDINPDQLRMVGSLLLLGIPMFYVLTFASLVEESEVEVAAMCAALGIGLWIIGQDISEQSISGVFRALAFPVAIPLVLYYTYTRRILPGLRIFKHVLRGISYASVGRYRWALISLRRALQLDPGNKWARDELWALHRQMDFEEIARDPETLAMVDFEMCLDRAATLLFTPPKPEQLQEATRLLDFVAQQQPDMLPRCDYWRSVAFAHQRQFEPAAECLAKVLAGSDHTPGNRHRQAILLAAWKFALGHPEMARRTGNPQLEMPGRRMEAIMAVEKQLQKEPEDTTTWDLKRLLYNDLKESEYQEAVPPGKKSELFDYGYCQELGMALINDSSRWERGADYLRIAAHGLPQVAPGLFVQIARASQKAGDFKGAWANYELAKNAGKNAGPQNLSAEEKKIYFQVVKMLADSKLEDGDVEAAIENFKLYTEYEGVGWETYKNLAELYERKGDVWSAVHAVEHALIYNAQNKDLQELKDKYYYSVTPEQLRERAETVFKWFDVEYCIRKARTLLDKQGADLELLEWANHLVELAFVLQPEKIAVQLLRARVRRLRGEQAEAVQMLEDIFNNKPEKFPSADEEEAWYSACKMLGDILLHEKPDVALQCFQEYRKFPKSGADTSYKLGVAYEALGDHARAIKCYEQVTAFEKHPLYSSALDAIRRIRSGGSVVNREQG